jgi:hypothetical protein
MSETQSSPADAPPLDAPVEVAVTRTGGFAGLTKRWLAEPAAAEASVWIDLIAQCPWDAPATGADSDAAPGAEAGAAPGAEAGAVPSPGADRFVWWIRARCGEQEEREAELPDDEIVGAWRALVDAVREWRSTASD